jgi:K+-sensing histidine kinase KdpD
MRLLAIGLSLGLVVLATAILWYLKTSGVRIDHVVFYYLVPNAFVAVLLGSVEAMLFAIVATGCAAFFLYDPLYSFYIADPREAGELVCFMALGLIGAKCVQELRRPRAPL